MTSDGDALFRAICEQPWEDTPRLAYADWLEENGDPERAEFIRVQIDLARADGPSDRKELASRAEELRERSQGQWTRGSPTGSGVRIGRDLHRGFYCAVTFQDDTSFGDHADATFAWAPIDTLSVMDLSTSTISRVLQSRYLGRLRSLTLVGEFGDAACDMIAETAHLSQLRELKLITAMIRDAGARSLAKSPHLAAVESLRLSRADRLSRETWSFLRLRFRHFGPS